MNRRDFCMEQCLNYTEIIGKLACPFTWISVLHFDEEYHQPSAREQWASHMGLRLPTYQQPYCKTDSKGQQEKHSALPNRRNKVDSRPTLRKPQAEKSAGRSTPEGCVHLATNASSNTPDWLAASKTIQTGTLHQLVASEVSQTPHVAAEKHRQHTAWLELLEVTAANSHPGGRHIPLHSVSIHWL